MAYDEGMLEILREATADLPVTEKRMFGGVALMLHGHMLTGVTKEGAMFRVGKANEESAFKIAGIQPLSFTGRKMGGFVETNADFSWSDQDLQKVLALACDNVRTLRPK